MGLKLRYHLFHGVDPGEVYEALSGFYEDTGGSLQIVSQPQPDDARYELRLHERDADWTVLDPHGGWEDETRRKAQLHVSRVLHTAGVLVYVYDGEYWLYELVANGVVLDQFIQDPRDAELWFPGRDSAGKPLLLAQQFPWVKPEDAAAYFVRMPTILADDGLEAVDRAAYDTLDLPARPGDEFSRFDQCGVLDFLRLLGIRVELRDHHVTLAPRVWKTFRIADDPWSCA